MENVCSVQVSSQTALLITQPAVAHHCRCRVMVPWRGNYTGRGVGLLLLTRIVNLFLSHTYRSSASTHEFSFFVLILLLFLNNRARCCRTFQRVCVLPILHGPWSSHTQYRHNNAEDKTLSLRSCLALHRDLLRTFTSSSVSYNLKLFTNTK